MDYATNLVVFLSLLLATLLNCSSEETANLETPRNADLKLKTSEYSAATVDKKSPFRGYLAFMLLCGEWSH